MKLDQQAKNFIAAHEADGLALLRELAVIPAPSNQEQLRAEFCKKWLEEHGAPDVTIDEALNVVCPIGDDGSKPLMVFMAHLDVVFPDLEPLPLKEENGLICCPGIGDDTASVVALLQAIQYLLETGITSPEVGLLFVCNTGEEGLGNLKGVRQICARYGDRMQGLITFDGSKLDQAVNCAVGSNRYEVTVTTQGGHSFGDFGRKNAIAELARLIIALYEVQVPEGGKTTYNIGLISGGTSVNTIAQTASMTYEIRSDRRSNLAWMEQQFEQILKQFRAEGMEIAVKILGQRPCGDEIDPAKQEALSALCSELAASITGKPLIFGSGSTDCNTPLSMGIPAVCMSVYNGGGAHTREEYVEIDSLIPGREITFSMILHYC